MAVEAVCLQLKSRVISSMAVSSARDTIETDLTG